MHNTFAIIGRIVSCVLFLALLFASIVWVNDVVLDKETNRYYMLNQELEKRTEKFDVLLFGSCHAYTSFNPIQFEKQHGYNAYNASNPGEIIPISYVRMVNEFQKRTPKVALVETWGVHPYNTYISDKEIMESYSPVNLESLPITKEKMEVIRDFEQFDPWTENFALARYKNRVVENELHSYDFRYDIRDAYENIPSYLHNFYFEMGDRFTHNGTRMYASNSLLYYDKYKTYVGDEIEPIDEKTMKYIDKIIELCEQSDVKLIFYRAPYLANETELKQENYLKAYLAERGIPYYDLEQELLIEQWSDFYDEQHLSVHGNTKATTFLGEKIVELMESA